MTLKRPVTLAAARRWPAAAARRESFCARMGGMRDKLTGDRTARDPRSKINRALAAWDCDEPELLERKHVTKGIRPMKITQKMVGAEARKNPIGRQQTYELAEENLANLKKRYQAVLLTMADLRDSLKRRKKGLPDDDMRGYTDAEISKLIQNFQTKAEDLRGAIAEYESGNWYKNPAPGAIKWEMYDPQSKTQRAMVGGVEILVTPVRSAAEARSYEMPDWTRAILEVAPDKLHANTQLPHGSVREAKDPLNVAGAIQFARKDYKPKTNPRRKPTVSRKISQLTREGYPQRQAVAIALSEQRAGKVRANPAMAKLYTVHTVTGDGKPRNPIAHFRKRSDALTYAKAYAKAYGAPVVLTSKAL